jgi:DNA-directed RNA polymerase specialized sigma24 family protein
VYIERMMTEKDEQSDEDLARVVQGGETDAFGTIVLRYEDKLRRYAKRFLLTDEVDDHLQDIFLSAFENIRSFDSSRKFSPWTYRIAHNMFVNAIRKRSLWRAARIDFDTVLPILVGNDRTRRSGAPGRGEGNARRCSAELGHEVP